MELAWVTQGWFVLVALAAYRLTRLWISDKLPPLPLLREKILTWVDRDFTNSTEENPTIDRWTAKVALYGAMPLSYLVTCYWCVGFWISLGTAAFAAFTPPWLWQPAVAVLALSAVVGLLGRLDD